MKRRWLLGTTRVTFDPASTNARNEMLALRPRTGGVFRDAS
jgi:hypothetical protein